MADKKKEVYDDDIIALMQVTSTDVMDRIKLVKLAVRCGTEGPQEADLTLEIDGKSKSVSSTGNGPVDASFNAVKALVEHSARLQLYQVSAVTEGTDAPATVTVRMEENGRIVTGQSAEADTVVASVAAYISALNRLLLRRDQTDVGYDEKSVNYKDAG